MGQCVNLSIYKMLKQHCQVYCTGVRGRGGGGGGEELSWAERG